ncbi:MAG: FAD-binding protein, partial [Rhodospirillaceae bacterium]|nr:FAD-binding protein [Rhodospirillaceae bacterium]
EVVPTAHYMMGGLEFDVDCSTELEGLFAAGEDTGGVHGANRLGGNGVANSTVFGGIAGDTLGEWTPKQGKFRDPDEQAIEEAVDTCRHPLTNPVGNVEDVRESLHELMWEDVGIIRDAESLTRGTTGLNDLEKQLNETGVDGSNLAFNMTWHDWLNLKNMITVSKSITETAIAREDSRGAHFRTDFPEMIGLETSAFTSVRMQGDAFSVETKPVDFNRVKPGETLIE